MKKINSLQVAQPIDRHAAMEELILQIVDAIMESMVPAKFIHYKKECFCDFRDPHTGQERRFVIYDNPCLSVCVINLNAQDRQWKKEYKLFLYDAEREHALKQLIAGATNAHDMPGMINYLKTTDPLYAGKITIASRGKRPDRLAALRQSYGIITTSLRS